VEKKKRRKETECVRKQKNFESVLFGMKKKGNKKQSCEVKYSKINSHIYFAGKEKRKGKLIPLRHRSQKLKPFRVCTAPSCSNQVFDSFFFVKKKIKEKRYLQT